MGILLMQVSGLIFAIVVAREGVRGLRGIPDRRGKVMSKGAAIFTLVMAALFAVTAIVGPMLFLPRRY
jgi:hypothetical protein